jgi:hypothetical protein
MGKTAPENFESNCELRACGATALDVRSLILRLERKGYQAVHWKYIYAAIGAEFNPAEHGRWPEANRGAREGN